MALTALLRFNPFSCNKRLGYTVTKFQLKSWTQLSLTYSAASCDKSKRWQLKDLGFDHLNPIFFQKQHLPPIAYKTYQDLFCNSKNINFSAAFASHSNACKLTTEAKHQNSKRQPTRTAINSTVDISEIVNRQKAPSGFKVIEFLPNAVAKDRRDWVSPQSLGIHPRDLSIFQTGSRMAIQRATITARDGAIFIKTGAVSAIVSSDKAVVLKSRRERENQNIIAPMLQAIATHENLPFELCAMEALLHSTVMYFEKRIGLLSWMLEIMLSELQRQSILGPFAAVSNEAMVRGLVPLDKALTSARNDAKETCAALHGILNDDDALSAICLTEQRNAMASMIGESGDFWASSLDVGPSATTMNPHLQQWQQWPALNNATAMPSISTSMPHASAGSGLPAGLSAPPPLPGGSNSTLPVVRIPIHAVRQAERMLQSYEREMSSVESTLREMEENLDTTRESWRMKLDSARNHMMLVNLWLSMLAISLMLTTVMPSFFGMNVRHGFEEDMWYFYAIFGISTFAGAFSFPLMFNFYKQAWKEQSEHELTKINRFRIVLMQHLDDLEDILEVCGRIPGKANKFQFSAYLKSQLPDLKLNGDTEDFLFHQFDVNKDGWFEAHELIRESARELAGRMSQSSNASYQTLRATSDSCSNNGVGQSVKP